MKQIKERLQSGNPVAPVINVCIPQSNTDDFAVSIEVKITPAKPICLRCGETKERVTIETPRGLVGTFWICGNAQCPTHDPDTGSAIPLPGEGEEIIDVEPVEKRRAA